MRLHGGIVTRVEAGEVRMGRAEAGALAGLLALPEPPPGSASNAPLHPLRGGMGRAPGVRGPLLWSPWTI